MIDKMTRVDGVVICKNKIIIILNYCNINFTIKPMIIFTSILIAEEQT